jgi:hypothetical protein
VRTLLLFRCSPASARRRRTPPTWPDRRRRTPSAGARRFANGYSPAMKSPLPPAAACCRTRYQMAKGYSPAMCSRTTRDTAPTMLFSGAAVSSFIFYPPLSPRGWSFQLLFPLLLPSVAQSISTTAYTNTRTVGLARRIDSSVCFFIRRVVEERHTRRIPNKRLPLDLLTLFHHTFLIASKKLNTPITWGVYLASRTL